MKEVKIGVKILNKGSFGENNNGEEEISFFLQKGTKIEGGKMFFFVDKTGVFFYLFFPPSA